MHLIHLISPENLCEMAIHICCEGEKVLFRLGYIQKIRVSSVWLFLSVHLQPVPVKPPEQFRIRLQKVGIGTVVKIELPFIGRVVVPKPTIATEVRKPGVNTHPRSTIVNYVFSLF